MGGPAAHRITTVHPPSQAWRPTGVPPSCAYIIYITFVIGPDNHYATTVKLSCCPAPSLSSMLRSPRYKTRSPMLFTSKSASFPCQ